MQINSLKCTHYSIIAYTIAKLIESSTVIKAYDLEKLS